MKSLLSNLCLMLVAFSVSSCQQKDSFTTPDLSFFELKGHVRTVQFEYDSETLEFTPEGILESKGGEYPYFEKGHYYGFSRGEKELNDYFVSYHDITSIENYQWLDGHVIHAAMQGEGACMETGYTYDENGDLKSSKSERMEPTSTCVSTNTYIITKRDEHGNWIEREVIYEQLTPEYHDGFLISNPHTSKSIEKRTIIYY